MDNLPLLLNTKMLSYISHFLQATKQRIRDLENTINSLKESVEKKAGEHEEAMVKLKALQDLHSSHHLNSSVRGEGSF